MRTDTKHLLDLTRALLRPDDIIEFELIAKTFANREGIPLRDALELMDRRWRVIQKHLRYNEHLPLTTTTWYGARLGVRGIEALTSDMDLWRCVPGRGHGQKAEAFLLATNEDHVLFIAEMVRLDLVHHGVRNATIVPLADALVQHVVSDQEAQSLLTLQPRPPTMAGLRRIGEQGAA